MARGNDDSLPRPPTSAAAPRRAALVCSVVALLGGVAPAWPAPAADLNAEQRNLIEQLAADNALMVARERRLADADQEALYIQLDAKDRKLRAAAARTAGSAAQLARIRGERDRIAVERRALVAALGQRDQLLAAEVRVFREVMTGVVRSATPQQQQALQLFADGKQREALAALDVIADATRAARDKATDIADAAERRGIAVLALQTHDEGEATLAQVVARYEQITRLDPGVAWDWIHLARLYDEQGRLKEARRAARSAYETLSQDVDRQDLAAALSAVVALDLKAGDLNSAKAHAEECLDIMRTLVAASPNSTEAQRSLGVSLERLGDIAMEADDLLSAKAYFNEALGVRDTLAHSGTPQARRDLAFSLEKLGDIAVREQDLSQARERYRASLVLLRKLSKENPRSAAAQRSVGISLMKLGDVARRANDLAAARAYFRESVGVAHGLVKREPRSAWAKRDVMAGLGRLGNAAALAADLRDARKRFEASLGIARELASADPTSAEARRDLAIGLEMVGQVALETRRLDEARARLEEALQIVRELATASPKSAEARRDLCIAVLLLGTTEMRAGDLTNARAHLEEALPTARKLAVDNPTVVQYQHDMADLLRKLDEISKAMTKTS